MRPSGRKPDQMRAVRIARSYTRHAEGSVLVEFGDTRVICTASVLNQQPPHLKGRAQGWVTAEYGMLPRATTPGASGKRRAAGSPAAPRKFSASSGAHCAPWWISTASASARSTSTAT